MTAMNLSQDINGLRERLHTLQTQADGPGTEHVGPLAQALEELATTLSELQVAEEELREQNDELLTARVELEQQRQRYQDLFDFAPDAYLVTDHHGTIREANQAAATLLAIAPRFLAGKPLVSFIDPADRRRFRDKLQALTNADHLHEWEVSITSRTGDALPAAVTITALRDQHGRPAAFRWLLRDLTERKRAEQQRLREEFLASISHDLRTPLTTIKGFAQVLTRQLARGQAIDTSEMTERMDSIVAAANTMERMVAGLLDLAREASDATPVLNRASVDLVALVRRLATTREKSNRSHQLHVTTTAEELFGEWDAERLERAIMNLISNAAKYSAAGAPIILSIDRQDEHSGGAGQEQPRGWAVVSVRDEGIGIPEADLPYVTQRFHRGANVSETIPGTGLGLAGARQTVEQHGGSISIASREGAGTTVAIRLPLG